MADPVSHLICYGTLMKGERNHRRCCADALTVEPAVTTGRLYLLSAGFPAMVEADAGEVFGEAMAFPDLDAALRDIDRLEGFRPDDPDGSMYLRIVRPVRLIRSGETMLAFCYLWNRPLPHGAALIPDGHWRGRFCAR